MAKKAKVKLPKTPTVKMVKKELCQLKKLVKDDHSSFDVVLEMKENGCWKVSKVDPSNEPEPCKWWSLVRLTRKSNCEERASMVVGRLKHAVKYGMIDAFMQEEPKKEKPALAVNVPAALVDTANLDANSYLGNTEPYLGDAEPPADVGGSRPAKQKGPEFKVHEYSTHFEVEHVPTGKTHPMGDGVDMSIGRGPNKLTMELGMEGFREAWEEWLNKDAEGTRAAYFPELATLDHPEEEAIEAWDRVKKEYGPKLKAVCESCAESAREQFGTDENWVEAPYESDHDQYDWCFTVRTLPGQSNEGDVSITFSLICEDHHNEPFFNINFIISIVEQVGLIVGGYTPHNHTDKVWVDARNDAAVKERWAEFENGCDPLKIVAIVKNHLKTQSS